jgi:hypothetical protein
MEVAEELMKSIVLTVDIWLKDIKEPDNALRAIAETGIAEGYNIGLEKLNLMVKSTKMFYSIVLKSIIMTNNYTYNSTIIGGIEGFFKLYNTRFTAHKIHITADYPVCFFPEGYLGIEFIRLYLNNIYSENQFIRMFDSAAIRQCIALYAINNNENVRDIYCNLYEAVLSAALACAAASEDIYGLKLSEDGKTLIREAAGRQHELSLKPYLKEVISSVEKTNEVSDSLKNYLGKTCREYEPDLKRMMFQMADFYG